MPIIMNDKVLNVKALEQEIKKKSRELRAKYTLNRQTTTEQQLAESKVIIDGREKKLNTSSKFFLDMISED